MMRKLVPAALLLPLFALPGCGSKDQEQAQPARLPQASLPLPADPEPVGALSPPSFAVDEPLPPFDELGSVPRIVAAGDFSGSGGHQATGHYRIYEIPGDRLLRVEALQVEDLLQLDLVLLDDESGLQAAVLLAPLKGSSGNQNYLIDPQLDLGRYRALAIVARDRSAVYARAPLQAPA